jgi:hypothetical protein
VGLTHLLMCLHGQTSRICVGFAIIKPSCATQAWGTFPNLQFEVTETAGCKVLERQQPPGQPRKQCPRVTSAKDQPLRAVLSSTGHICQYHQKKKKKRSFGMMHVLWEPRENRWLKFLLWIFEPDLRG